MKNKSTGAREAPAREAPAREAPEGLRGSQFVNDEQMLEHVQRAHFQHFVELQHPATGLTLDRSATNSPASIAAVGFALTAYPAAVERGWITRPEARAYTLKVLRTLWMAPQGDEAHGVSGYRGFFYHFLDPATGLRATTPRWWMSELSTIDTALLMAGVLFAKNYFAGSSADETEIRKLADSLYRRVEWTWFLTGKNLLGHGWSPEGGMIGNVYRGLSEAHLLYLLALGSPAHAVPAASWQAYLRGGAAGTQAEKHYGQRFVRCLGSPLFVYQYPQVWIDFRGIRDPLNKRLGFDYFENSRRAVTAQHRYAQHNPLGWQGYDRYTWGITASDGPGFCKRVIDGKSRMFNGYSERGCPSSGSQAGGLLTGSSSAGNAVDNFDDGTIAPTAAISSLPFTPAIVLATLRRWLDKRPEIFGRRGFFDAFNPTFDESTSSGWIAPETISIDQGAILTMIENYRSQLIWNTMQADSYLHTGLTRAGFTGGWLSR